MLQGLLPLERPHVVFDTETTGTNSRSDRISEIACLKIQPDGRRAEAYRYLHEAADHGWGDPRALTDGPEFASLAGESEFESIVEAVRSTEDPPHEERWGTPSKYPGVPRFSRVGAGSRSSSASTASARRSRRS